MTCFSFYATKNITSGEGGALTTNRQEWADRIAMMALHGISRDAWKRYGTEGYRHWDIIAPGYKYNMFDLQAALVRSQFDKLERLSRAARRAEGAPRCRPARPAGDRVPGGAQLGGARLSPVPDRRAHRDARARIATRS